MVVALALGLIWGGAARWTERATVPILTVIMTLATMGVSPSTFRNGAHRGRLKTPKIHLAYCYNGFDA
mgnify:CR=1 FL=1